MYQKQPSAWVASIILVTSSTKTSFNSAARNAGIFASLLLCLPYVANAQNIAPQTTSVFECTQVALDDVDQSLLTKEERIALLDKSLYASIDSFSTCVSSVTQDTSAGAGQGAQGSQSVNNGDGQTTTADSGNSAQGGQQAQSTEEEMIAVRNATRAQTPRGTLSAAKRGIIAPKDNDRIICKLLYQEITNTQDPDMLKGLKQQYSNYACG